MHLKSLELSGFKSFAKKTELEFSSAITAIVGPNGSGKSNVAEAFRFVLGEQSIKSMRGKRGEDLIFNGSGTTARMNRASVRVVFDNAPVDGKRMLPLEYDEVSIERAVHRDGENEYSINGSKVRLRDVIELLAGANIGASGHHIISQGEADRVLSANPKERRSMIEDALGLRVFQYKKEESRKKLEKTEENRKQVESLRKENAPHLRFLEKQVEKLHKAVELRDQLAGAYQEYLRREQLYLTYTDEVLVREREVPEEALRDLASRLEEAKRTLAESDSHDAKSDEVLRLESALRDTRMKRDTLTRDLGRLEGEIVALERQNEREARTMGEDTSGSVPLSDVRAFADEFGEVLASAATFETIPQFMNRLEKLATRLEVLLERSSEEKSSSIRESSEAIIRELRRKHEVLHSAIEEILSEERALEASYDVLRKEIEGKKDQSRSAEKALFEIMREESIVRTTLERIHLREAELARAKEEFERELREAAVLVGSDVLEYTNRVILSESGTPLSIEELVSEERRVQEERRRTLEKQKIRLEEMGGASAEDIMKEYREVKERDTFLARELADLEESRVTLQNLISELEAKIDAEFSAGINHISKEFNTFFTLMFGGGSATLSLVVPEKRGTLSLEEEGILEDEPSMEGVDVSVHLPNKKLRGLAMLSGGERALTSIALIFAMSQVNPPPFLILDETDAALDEANSRRYGDMIENLAKKSELILITHNRETMSRAGILYGVTMGLDGASKILSVRFEEAVAVAK